MLSTSQIRRRCLRSTRSSSSGDCCQSRGAKCGLGTLCTHLSLQSLALGLTDLVDKEVPQKGKTGFPFAPRVPSEPFQRRGFERKEYT